MTLKPKSLIARTLALICTLGLAGAAWGANPVAVWDGDFTAKQTGYNLNRSGNALSQDNSTITINQSVGVKVDFTTGFSDAMTVMFKYSDLKFDAQKTLATSFCSGGDENRTGVYAASGGTINGIWNTGNWNNPMETLSESSGVLAFCYSKTGGTSFYYISANGTRTELFNKSGLKAGGDTAINGCTIGGERAKSGATLLGAATGMKISAIAIFEGILTQSDMTSYVWPLKTVSVAANTSVSAINTLIAGVDAGATKVVVDVADGVKIDVDTAFVASKPTTIASNGNVTLSAATQPDASYFSAVDFSGVKGALLRTWLTNPGVIGVNFNSNTGSGTSGVLAECNNWLNDGVGHNVKPANGSSTALFTDGLTKAAWVSANTWSSGFGTILSGYLDDGAVNGNGAEVYVTGLPFASYDVIIYCNSDSNPGAFLAKTVNGTEYTWSSDNGTTVEGSGNWGTAAKTVPEYGVNALRVNNLSGILEIYGGARNGSNRGGIAAIQILPAGTADINHVYNATINGNTAFSDIAWQQDDASATLYDLPNAILVIDGTGAITGLDTAPAKITLGENVTLDVTNIPADNFAAIEKMGSGVYRWTANHPATVPNGFVYEYVGGATSDGAVTINPIEVGGTLKTSGFVNLGTYSAAYTSTTLDVLSGTTRLNCNDQAVCGYLKVQKGATLVNEREADAIIYSTYNTTVDVWGTLDMGETRWTLWSGATINVHGGTITGAGQGENGALDFMDSSSLNVDADSTISASVKFRNSLTSVTIEPDCTLTLSGTIRTQYDGAGVNKKGEGTLKFTSAPNNLPKGISVEAGKLVFDTESDVTTAVTYANDPSPDANTALAFTQQSNWKGTVVLNYAITGGSNGSVFQPGKYGNANSTVCLGQGATDVFLSVRDSSSYGDIDTKLYFKDDVSLRNGWGTEVKATTIPQLGADEGVTFTTRQGAISSNGTTYYTITALKDFAGTIALSDRTSVTVGNVVLDELPAEGALVVKATRGNSDVKGSISGSVTVGQETVQLVYGTVGNETGLVRPVSVTVPSVANTTVTVKIGDTELERASDDKYYVVPGSTVVVTYTAETGYAISNGEGSYTLENISSPQEVAFDDTKVIDCRTYTWTAAVDNSWSTAGNWDCNKIPTVNNPVVFPAETAPTDGWVVYVGKDTDRCASMTVSGNVTMSLNDTQSDWSGVGVAGDVTGTGTLTLWRSGINSYASEKTTISCPLVIKANESDSFLQKVGFDVTGTVVVNSLLVVYDTTEFTNKMTLNDGAIVRSNGSNWYGDMTAALTFSGGIEVAENATASFESSSQTVTGDVLLGAGSTFTLSAGTDAANATFKLGEGAKLYVPAGALVTEANITAVDDECYVAKNGTVYTVDTYKTVTFSGDNMTVTRTDSLGDAIKAGDTVTFTVAPAKNYKVESVKVGATELTAVNGTYSLVVDDNVEVAVTTALDLVTFTVEVPENTTVTVTGATLVEGVEGNNYQAIIGAKVTITYTPTGAYVGGAVQQVVTVTQNQAAVQAPAEYAPVPAVAQVGNDYYATLQAAVDQGNVTVKILGDVTLADKLVVDGGQTVAFEADSAVTVTGQLRVVGGSACTIGQKVTFTSAAHPTVFVLGDPAVKTPGTAKSTLVVNGAVANTNPTFDGAFAISGNGLDTQGVNITINGTVTNPNGIAIYQPQPGSLTVNGTVSGASAISIKDGTLTVGENAVVTAVLANGLPYVGNNNGDSPTGDAIIAPYYPASKGYGTPVVNIQGGTITVADTSKCAGIEAYDFDGVEAPEDASSNVNVSGGTFNTPVELKYCAAGVIPAKNGSGSYGVEAGYVITWVVDGAKTITTVKDGVTPTMTDPSKANYTFAGWDPAVVAAEANATYTATWTANGVTLGTPAVAWGADFTNAVVSATVENGYSDVVYTLTYNSNVYDGTVENGKVTFNVPVAAADRYEDFDYTIAAKVKGSSVGSANGSEIIADEKDWFFATASTTTGGAWATTPTVEDDRMTFSGDNTFTPTDASSGKIVVIDMGNVVFGDTNDAEINDAQAGIRIGANGTFVVLTTGNVWQDTKVAADGEAEYNVVITFNYTTMTYSVKVGDDTISGIALAGNKTKVSSIEFKGAGSLESLTGEYFEGAMVKDNNGATYDTVEDAIAALKAGTATAPLTMLHDGTAPQGWAIDEKGVLAQASVVVETTADTVLVCVPQACKADALINLSNRTVGDVLQVYSATEQCYYTWALAQGDGDTLVWKPADSFKVAGDDKVTQHQKPASEETLTVGQAVWVTRVNAKNAIMLNGAYATADKTPVTVQSGWNLVAPVPQAGETTYSVATVAEPKNKEDKIVIPTTGAPINCQWKDGGWKYYRVYKPKDAKRAVAEWADAPSVPAGTGFWYVSGDSASKSVEL